MQSGLSTADFGWGCKQFHKMVNPDVALLNVHTVLYALLGYAKHAQHGDLGMQSKLSTDDLGTQSGLSTNDYGWGNRQPQMQCPSLLYC